MERDADYVAGRLNSRCDVVFVDGKSNTNVHVAGRLAL